MIHQRALTTLAVGLLVAGCGASAQPASVPVATSNGVVAVASAGATWTSPAASSTASPPPSGPPYASHEEAQPLGSVIFGPLVRDATGRELIDEGAPEPQGTPTLTLTVGPSEQGLAEAGLPDRYTFGAYWGRPLSSTAIVVSLYRVTQGALEVLFSHQRTAEPGALGYSETLPAFPSVGRYRLEVTTTDGIVLAWGLMDVNGTCSSTGCSGG